MEVRYQEVSGCWFRGVPVEYYKIIIGAIFNKNLNSSNQNY